MAQAGSRVAGRLLEILTAPGAGLNAALSKLAEREGVPVETLPVGAVRVQNAAPEIAEKGAAGKYPSVHLYCEKLQNLMREKFRTFSGKARMVAEARLTQDRLEGVEQRTHIMVDAITDLLDASRGDWGSGMHFGGGYEVTFGPVKQGGRNYLQIAKVTFEVDISLS